MRKIIVIIAYFICIEGTIAQIYTHTENYILSTTCLDADCVKKSQTIQYFDGLGRLKQSIGIKATPKGRDLVTPTEYDNYGRQTKDYLPIPQSGTQNGGFYQNPLSNAPSVYGNESIYSEKILENSPLDRVLGQIQVGNDWRNKPVRFQYEANLTTDGVYKITTRTTWEQGATKSTISILGTYADAQLYKTTTTDEDGNPSIEFKNGEGQTLLVRKILEGKNIDTYYIYNEYNQLAFVIPPLAVEEIAETTNLSVPTLDSLCYQYRYDGRGRMVEKKLPSKGWEYMVYDQLDRLVLTQDANLRGTGNNFKAQGWIFTKYDQFNRVVYTGFFRNSSSREQMQTALNNIRSNHHESRSHTPFNFNNNDIYYTRNAFPKSSLTILSVNYYDTYPANSPAIPNDIWGQETLKPEVVNHRSTKGLALVSMVKNIEDDGWTKNYTYYDTKGREIGTLIQNHLGGYTKTESRLDFSGIAQQTNTYHKRQSSDKEIKIAERFEYNAHNPALLEKHYHQVNEEAEELLAEHSYNEIGQLETKKVGGTQGNPLQTINYQYNIRGWMTGINNPNNLGENYFGYKISYQNPVSNGVEKGLYNGNISQVDWATKNDGILRRYTYQYDGLNRLLSAFYSKPNATIPSTNAYNESLTYDANGNILTLNRFGGTDGNQAMKIDELVYEYRGNQLQKITDNSLNISGYPQGGNGILYDPNGNMTKHLDKGISRIEYNFLNLPSRIIKRTGDDFVKYTYRADGVKVNKMSHNRIINYLDGFQYEMSYAKHSQGIEMMSPHSVFFPTAEGYYDVKEKRYVYNYTDHLGNIRLSYSRSGIIETNHYYPLGLKHEGYDTFPKSIGGGYQYKYQGQELQLDTGWYSFKWRNYDPTFARFFNIDPLSEKFPYNSTYAFQENKMGLGRELEGLELLRERGLITALGMTQNDIYVVEPPPSYTHYFDQKENSFLNQRMEVEKLPLGAAGMGKWENGYFSSFAGEAKVTKLLGAFELIKLAKIAIETPKTIKMVGDNAKAFNYQSKLSFQFENMKIAQDIVNKANLKLDKNTKTEITNYIFNGSLPKDISKRSNSVVNLGSKDNIVKTANSIMRANGIVVRKGFEASLIQELEQKKIEQERKLQKVGQ